jgi:hypothetical protein
MRSLADTQLVLQLNAGLLLSGTDKISKIMYQIENIRIPQEIPKRHN